MTQEPKCPMSGCGAAVMRPKCLFDLTPDDCPRHGLAIAYRKKYLCPECSHQKHVGVCVKCAEWIAKNPTLSPLRKCGHTDTP